MHQLKPITTAGVPGALQKAERYRLLNEPSAAESICLDILDVEPGNQEALIMLLLARTDQFAHNHASAAPAAREVLPRITDPYKRSYYAGVLEERRAKALWHSGRPGSLAMAAEGFREAMACYERAESHAPAGEDDARLRWNTCARILNDHPSLAPRAAESWEPVMGE